MNVDEAALAIRTYELIVINGEYFVFPCCTREYIVDETASVVGPVERAEAQAACDRLNLIAVLKAIREPTDAMCAAGRQDHKDAWCGEAPIFEHSIYRAMIDALIAEVGK